ncbi:hypothetical protein Tco_0684742 [Tanacetum coccineum]
MEQTSSLLALPTVLGTVTRSFMSSFDIVHLRSVVVVSCRCEIRQLKRCAQMVTVLERCGPISASPRNLLMSLHRLDLRWARAQRKGISRLVRHIGIESFRGHLFSGSYSQIRVVLVSKSGLKYYCLGCPLNGDPKRQDGWSTLEAQYDLPRLFSGKKIVKWKQHKILSQAALRLPSSPNIHCL